MGAGTADLAVGTAVFLAAVSALLMLIGMVSWRRTGQNRLLWVSLGFLGMLLQGLWYVRTTYQQRGAIAAGQEPFPLLLWLDLGVVVALYLAVLKR